MNRDVCEHFNPVNLPCDKCKPASVQKSTLREAAQQALKALEKAAWCVQHDYQPDNMGHDWDGQITALRAALAESVQECPHGVTDDNCKECYGVATNSEPITVYSVPLRCPNCASLQDQNTELDRKLADLEQTSLELCKACGWRTVIPGEGCLNCARSKLAELERKPLTEEEIKRIDDSTHFHESPDWSLRFARAIERAHGIGDSDE